MFVLFTISSSLLSQRRTQIVDMPIESKDGSFKLYNSTNHCVIHSITSEKNNVTNHGVLVLNLKDYSPTVVALKGIDKTNPFFYSANFTRNGFGYFEAFENKKDNKIDLYFHEISFREFTTTSSVIHSIKGGDRKKMLLYFAENSGKRKSALYVVNVGDEKQNAKATIINLDDQRKLSHTQEVGFNGAIDAEFSSYVGLSDKGSLVTFHQIKNNKGAVSSEINVVNTNLRESNKTQKFTVSSDDNETLTSHKIYVDDNDFVHFYGTVQKKNDSTQSFLQYKVYGLMRNSMIVSHENVVKLNNNIRAHSLLTLSADYTFYIVEEGNVLQSNNGMDILAISRLKNKHLINHDDDPETKRKKEEEIRRLKEQGQFDNINLTGPGDLSKNSIHIFCLDKNKDVLWTDVIRRNASYSAEDLAEMDDAQFGIYFWAVGDKFMCIYNKDQVTSVTTPVLSSNDKPGKKPQTTSIREYSIKSNRFFERDFEASEKSAFKYVILPGFTKINSTQSVIVLIKTEKGAYYPMAMMF